MTNQKKNINSEVMNYYGSLPINGDQTVPTGGDSISLLDTMLNEIVDLKGNNYLDRFQTFISSGGSNYGTQSYMNLCSQLPHYRFYLNRFVKMAIEPGVSPLSTANQYIKYDLINKIKTVVAASGKQQDLDNTRLSLLAKTLDEEDILKIISDFTTNLINLRQTWKGTFQDTTALFNVLSNVPNNMVDIATNMIIGLDVLGTALDTSISLNEALSMRLRDRGVTSLGSQENQNKLLRKLRNVNDGDIKRVSITEVLNFYKMIEMSLSNILDHNLVSSLMANISSDEVIALKNIVERNDDTKWIELIDIKVKQYVLQKILLIPTEVFENFVGNLPLLLVTTTLIAINKIYYNVNLDQLENDIYKIQDINQNIFQSCFDKTFIFSTNDYLLKLYKACSGSKLISFILEKNLLSQIHPQTVLTTIHNISNGLPINYELVYSSIMSILSNNQYTISDKGDTEELSLLANCILSYINKYLAHM